MEETVTQRIHVFCIVCLMVLIANSSSNALGYWPIVFQVAKEGSDFQFSRGPIRIVDGGVSIDSKARPSESAVSYKLVLREYVSFREDILKATEAYVQMYPSNVRANESGKEGEALFNGAVIKRFNLVLPYPGENFTFDESNYRFKHDALDFPIPLYGYLSSKSAFIRIPASLLATDINLTFRMDPNVLWEVSVVSVIVHVFSDQVTQWWQHNLSLVVGTTLTELITVPVVIVTLRRLIPKRKEVGGISGRSG